MSDIEYYVDETSLFDDIQKLIEETQQRVLHQVSHAGVMLYWHIGNRINSDILEHERADYGRKVVRNLADKLHAKYGKGYSAPVIYKCVKFSKLFNSKEVVFSLSSHLKWTHFVNLFNIKDGSSSKSVGHRRLR